VSSANVSLFCEKISKESLKAAMRLFSWSSSHCFQTFHIMSSQPLIGDDARKLSSLPPTSKTCEWAKDIVCNTADHGGGDPGGEDSGDDLHMLAERSYDSSKLVRGDDCCSKGGEEEGSRLSWSSITRYGRGSIFLSGVLMDLLSRICIVLLYGTKECTGYVGVMLNLCVKETPCLFLDITHF
jgi:hypothetical protein